MRSASVCPDLSSDSLRVSETVRIAILTGRKGRDSSNLGMAKTPLRSAVESGINRPFAGGKRIEIGDNLFEIGASSLKLIEIHEQIDRQFPGLIDLTELFDHPTIAELARHLSEKLTAPATG